MYHEVNTSQWVGKVKDFLNEKKQEKVQIKKKKTVKEIAEVNIDLF